jgi:putative ABC transport system substrate-binding protein
LISRRSVLFALALGAAGSPLLALAQPARTFRLGFLGSESASEFEPLIAALRSGLKEAGYTEGRNLAIEFRWADRKYDRLAALAADLVKSKVEVIVTHGTPGTRAAQKATATIPIVMATSGDAVATGLVQSLGRPGGNTTGLTALGHDMMKKRLELLKEILPQFSHAGVLLAGGNFANRSIVPAMKDAARALKVSLELAEVKGPADFDEAFSALATKRVTGVTSSQEGMFLSNARRIAEAAGARRIAVAGGKEAAEAGALVGYGPDFREMYRHAAQFVDKLFKGARAADLAVEQPTKFELVLNQRTARALGLRIPQSMLVRADRVIE